MKKIYSFLTGTKTCPLFLVLVFFLSFCIKINAQDKVIDRICGDYDVRVDLWGYNMSGVTGFSSWEFWDYYEYVWDDEGEMFNYHSGLNPAGNNIPYSHYPTIEKIDDTTVKIHNLLRDFQGLFTDQDYDYTLWGTVDEQNMTLTIPAQLYGDNIYFAKTCSYPESGAKVEELEAVVFTISYKDQYVVLQTKGTVKTPKAKDSSFALFYENDAKTGLYANIGYCTALFYTQGQYVSYDYNFTSVDPEPGMVSELSVLRFLNPSNSCVNDNLVNQISVQKDGSPLEVEFDYYVDRISDRYTDLEFSTPVVEAGEYVITFPAGLFGDFNYQSNDFKAGLANPEFTLTYTIGDGTGIAGVKTGEGADAVLYDLQGVKVDGKSAKAGVYIRKTGTKTEKVYIR